MSLKRADKRKAAEAHVFTVRSDIPNSAGAPMHVTYITFASFQQSSVALNIINVKWTNTLLSQVDQKEIQAHF